MRVVIVTMDTHLASASARAAAQIRIKLPGTQLSVHAASRWAESPESLATCRADIAVADIVIVSMLFMEDHYLPVLDALKERRDHCDAMLCMMSCADVTKLTRLGKFDMSSKTSGPLALLKRLRGKKDSDPARSASGAQQMKLLRRVPQILRFIPGTAQDVRIYFLALQYWLAGSDCNIANLVHMLVDRYATGPRESLRGIVKPQAPVAFPEIGLYHPSSKGTANSIGVSLTDLPMPPGKFAGTVGVLLMRSYLLAGNRSHYDAVIHALEARGLRTIAAFASGLDARPAIESYFMKDGKAAVDAVVSLTGFSLVGGPAYNDARSAEELLSKLDVPYLSAMPVEFQSLTDWEASDRGLLPVESTMMVAIPELDGATGAMVFGGRRSAPGSTGDAGTSAAHDMSAHDERVEMLASRVAKWVALRRKARCDRQLAIVLFNFPPNAGSTGTAAFLAVFESLFNLLRSLREQGYTVDVPDSVDDLRRTLTEGNSSHYGSLANVAAHISVDTHVRQQRWLSEIERQWGPAPGKHQTDGKSIQVLGCKFGNVFVGIQPSFGYEGDPMRLLFQRGLAPTHAFCAFYRWIRDDYKADAVLHFGTHGALEFMPGKQAGMSAQCWPDRLISDLPNVYLYASNNPSEGTVAKRRAAATLVSYLTPPLSQAGLYRELSELKSSLQRWRALQPDAAAEREGLAQLIHSQAVQLQFADPEPTWTACDEAAIHALVNKLMEVEETLIPNGLHVLGRIPNDNESIDTVLTIAKASGKPVPPEAVLRKVIAGSSPESALSDVESLNTEEAAGLIESLRQLAQMHKFLVQQYEMHGLLHALDGGFVRPAPGGDILHNADVLPAGRNLHGFDPFRMPSTYAVIEGRRQAEYLLSRYRADGNALPESIAMVLWGTDNLKTEGGPIAQALALMGAAPRFDSYGRLAGAQLLSLSELGRPRIDVMLTLSGIFRDLLPLQIKLLAEAAYLAATADEPAEQNFIRKHSLSYMHAHGCSIEVASLRVFGNAEGAYGANVNHLIDSSCWNDDGELAETYSQRKGFAYGCNCKAQQQPALLQSILSSVDLAYQNLESVEVGVTTIDTYFDTLGGVSRAVRRAQVGREAPIYIGDYTTGKGSIRTLAEQVALETRTRTLNPKWYESMLEHGYEGVRQIEAQVTNTMGWSATTGQVAPWVYQQITQTFLLDRDMRERLAALNPVASARVATRLLEAHERKYWQPDAATLAELQRAGEDLEDRVEGIYQGATA
jgi:magnesium chelatase subunit H